MELKIKLMKWSAGIPVVMLNPKTAVIMGVHIHDRVSIKSSTNNHKEMSTIVDIVEGFVKEDEIGISSEVRKIMNFKNKQRVIVNISESPKSLNYIKKKLNNKNLSEKEIAEIIKDIVENALSEPEIALFISAMYERGMNMKETVYLTKAIINSGNRIKFKSKLVVDKHSIGGIPGNRTTPIVVSICSSLGLIFPKASSRAITSSAGTADVIETITPVEFSVSEVKKIIKKTNACLIWGGGKLNVVPADSKIIYVEKALNIDPDSQLLASIMAKKIAMGANYILIDI
ncbi:MAG: thymidine phosphorylase, partial [Nanoarchaeota archaeon]